MQRIILTVFLILSTVSLNANTELQKQAQHAQNYLDWTISRVSYAWEKMKYHFHEGNKRLKDSAGLNNETIKKQIDKVRNK